MMRIKVITVMMVMLFSVSTIVTTIPTVKANPHTDITVAQAYAMIYGGSVPNLVIIDVRGATSPPESYPENYNNGHIMGAINVPVLPPSPFDFTALYVWINSTVGQSHKDDTIIVNCRTGTRSNLTCNILDASGFTKVYDMLGGYLAWVAAGYPTFSVSNWTLVTDSRPLKAYPDLGESIWQKNASMSPNGPYDKIGLHRLVKTGITPVGVVFLVGCPMWGVGEQMISNPPGDNWTKYENYCQAIYWANRGFDVYAIDFRTHFIPAGLNSSQLSFMANYGFDVWISDMKEAANKVKEVSGSSKFFIAGQCTGGVAALNYATKYWKDDLSGIILLDPHYFTLGYPIVGTLGTETNTYNLTQAISNMTKAGTYAYTPTLTLTPALAAYALQNPGAPAEYPAGTPLTPKINPLTNKTWTNITEYVAYNVTYNTAYYGMYSDIIGGYGNVTQFEYSIANRDFVPNRLILEINAMVDWVNCPYLTYDWNDHYKEIGVPVLAFATGLFLNRTGTFRFVNGINNTDFTTVMLKNYGHTDPFYGTYSARDVSQPALDWMTKHLPARAFAFGNTNVGTYWDQNDANAKSASYFTCGYTGTVTDIFAYVARVGAAGDGAAAIYADNGGSPGALIATTGKATVGTSFSWADFPLLSPVSVTSGTGYWLAISSNNALNLNIVVGSGVRVHNGVSSWFSDPFGPVWGTDATGAMSIYASGTSNIQP